ncbi:alpha/beta family hydrolase [Aquihabitans sp. McL0605]|uniref:alpha/beta hydrolase family protein n=1 Tax=Aquihabitans sp. McL0605 TaxID=3415671 RepID=UPI003CF2730E
MGRARPVGALLLTHGAGGHRDQPALVAIEDELAPLPVRRMNFPYRDLGPKRPPDRAPKLIASIREQAADLCAERHIRPGRLALGGRSMGGRMCSMAVADGLPAAALILIAYPLHPPGKPDTLRIEHLPQLEVPCLFVSGTRDPFGTPDELEAATAVIPGPVTHHRVEGKGHDLKGSDQAVAAVIHEWIRSL